MLSYPDNTKVKLDIEQRLAEKTLTFQAAFILVNQLDQYIEASPDLPDRNTIRILFSLVRSERFTRKKQCFFLFQSILSALIRIVRIQNKQKEETILFDLQKLLHTTTGHKHRAIAQALGTLPLAMSPPEVLPKKPDILPLAFHDLLDRLSVLNPKQMRWYGRSLAGKTEHSQLGIIKFLKPEDQPDKILSEPMWMDIINHLPDDFKPGVTIPQSIKINGTCLFQLSDIPGEVIKTRKLHDQKLAIAFKASQDYFSYANIPSCQNSDETILTTFKRNAAMLGMLSGKGIIHTALIPLFHNRVQQDRRQDGGHYLWEHGGRLDQWLESCQYPNFGTSGLRDFEHFIPLTDQTRFHHYIGTHILSFILVAGSYFRNKKPELKGLDENGHPVDVRHIFNPHLFRNLISISVRSYYHALTGQPLNDFDLLVTDLFIQKLIDRMGVDHDMEEHLRIEDQNRMDDSSFFDFLASREIVQSPDNLPARGKTDMVFLSGPHLGGFNQPISVPELTDLLFTISALCISGRYALENGLNPPCD